jgi:hypothetical protein
MQIKITYDKSSVAGFISWERLAKETFHGASELRFNEYISHFEVDERGIKYFVSTVTNVPQ